MSCTSFDRETADGGEGHCGESAAGGYANDSVRHVRRALATTGTPPAPTASAFFSVSPRQKAIPRSWSSSSIGLHISRPRNRRASSASRSEIRIYAFLNPRSRTLRVRASSLRHGSSADLTDHVFSNPNFRSRVYSCIRDIPSCLAAWTLLPSASRMARSTALFSRVSRFVMRDSGTSFVARRQRCSVSMNGPSHMMRARSSTFRSSRTLPGQSWPHNVSIASGVTSALLPANSRRKLSASGRIRRAGRVAGECECRRRSNGNRGRHGSPLAKPHRPDLD